MATLNTTNILEDKIQYKCVPAPTGLVIDKKGSHAGAVRSYADLINREVSGGWQFHSLETISVTQDPGCLSALLYKIPIIGGLLGKPPITLTFNMLIFSSGSSSSGNTSSGSSSGLNISNVSPIRPAIVNVGDTWTCKKCGESNPIASSSCKDCGEYK